jgi:hypothetical protein
MGVGIVIKGLYFAVRRGAALGDETDILRVPDNLHDLAVVPIEEKARCPDPVFCTSGARLSIAIEKNDLVPGDRVARACHQALILIHLVLPVDMQYENLRRGWCRLC